MHLWMDGLEPQRDIVEAVRREQRRIDAGWAPFWHYQGLGMYGRQVADLYDQFAEQQILILRYKHLVDSPTAVLDRVFEFLGVEPAGVESIPRDNSRVFVRDGARTRAFGTVIRVGAAAGKHFPPQVWRSLSRPLIARLHKGGDPARPRLTPQQRDALLAPHLPDIELLEQVTGESFDDWKGYRDGGSFESRRAGAKVTSG
jgi:hypothetical protein